MAPKVAALEAVRPRVMRVTTRATALMNQSQANERSPSLTVVYLDMIAGGEDLSSGRFEEEILAIHSKGECSGDGGREMGGSSDMVCTGRADEAEGGLNWDT